MAKTVFSETVRAKVRFRAQNCCEYCRGQDKFSPVYFSIDHVLPLAKGGTDHDQNLAYCCMPCDRLKWNKLAGFDPVSNQDVPLFHPRTHIWGEHFEWSDDFLMMIGLSAIGRATIVSLQLNREKLISYRLEMFEIGHHPPV